MRPVEELKAERIRLLEALRSRPSGMAWCARHSDFVDRVLQDLFTEVLAGYDDPPRLALIATGGYGRRELAPYSDLDLTLSPLDDTHPQVDRIVKDLFNGIRDVCVEGLGYKVGYTYRLVPDVPGLDAATRTALMDARQVAGESDCHDAIQEALWQDFPAADFIIAKIKEREYHLAKTHETPLVTSPHLKEGAGGLRSLQAANWIRMALNERPLRQTAAYDAVLRARNLLQVLAQRQAEQMSLEKRVEAAGLERRQPNEYATRLVEAMTELHEAWLASLKRIKESRFALTRHVTAARGEARIGREATAGEAALALSLAIKLDIAPPDEPVRVLESSTGAEAMAALGSGEAAIRAMDKAGVLEALLPELTACRALMPGDVTHRYTVMEHSLRLLRNLESLKPGSLLGDIYASLRDRSVLILACLLHDTGKAVPGEDHSEAGAVIASQVAERWSLPRADHDKLVWLVLHHLVMAHTIRMRDLQNPEVIREFAAFVGSEERLECLTLLTWADVNAVAPEAWTQSQEVFLEHLWLAARAALADKTPETDPAAVKKRLSAHLESSASPEEIKQFLDSLPAHYVLSTPPEQVPLHYRMVQRARNGEPDVVVGSQRALGVTEITICAADRPGLLSEILAVIYAHDLRLQGLRASTTTGLQPTVLDVIYVTFGDRELPYTAGARVARDLGAVLRGTLVSSELLSSKGKDAARKQQIYQWKLHPGDPPMLEVRAPRGRGMAYRMSKLIAAQGWNILSARVGQWAGQGAASFVVTRQDGKPLSQQEVAEQLGKPNV